MGRCWPSWRCPSRSVSRVAARTGNLNAHHDKLRLVISLSLSPLESGDRHSRRAKSRKQSVVGSPGSAATASATVTAKRMKVQVHLIDELRARVRPRRLAAAPAFKPTGNIKTPRARTTITHTSSELLHSTVTPPQASRGHGPSVRHADTPPQRQHRDEGPYSHRR